jgi:hypothetical protein
MSSQSNPQAPGSPTGRKSSKLTKAPGAPKRKRKGLRHSQLPGARNLFDSGALGMEGSTQKPMAGGRRRRRKSKRKSHKKSHKKKRKTKRRRKSRKNKSKRRRRR